VSGHFRRSRAVELPLEIEENRHLSRCRRPVFCKLVPGGELIPHPRQQASQTFERLPLMPAREAGRRPQRRAERRGSSAICRSSYPSSTQHEGHARARRQFVQGLSPLPRCALLDQLLELIRVGVFERQSVQISVSLSWRILRRRSKSQQWFAATLYSQEVNGESSRIGEVCLATFIKTSMVASSASSRVGSALRQNRKNRRREFTIEVAQAPGPCPGPAIACDASTVPAALIRPGLGASIV